MSTDAPFTPPKKKPNMLWWLAGGLALMVFVLQLLGPNPRIIVSRQTTHVTQPLNAVGLPDYEKCVLEMYRSGVAPENNAAVLLWQALWPGELNSSEQESIAKAIGLEESSVKAGAFVSIRHPTTREEVLRWLMDAKNVSANVNASLQRDHHDESQPAGGLPNSDTVDEVINQGISRPWRSEQIPPLANWVANNNERIDLIVEAAARPRYCSPSPSLLDGEPTRLLDLLLPDSRGLRDASSGLSARAMLHLGAGRVEEAWTDLLACHRLARLAAQGHTLVEQQAALAIHLTACDGALQLLNDSKLTSEQARRIRRELTNLSSFSKMADAIDQCDRFMFLDAIVHEASGRIGERDELDLGVFSRVSVDWNIALIEGNRWFDRLAKACRIADYRQRQKSLAQIEAELKVFELKKERIRGPAILLSRKLRSEVIASIFVSGMLPAADLAMNAEDRANTILGLTRLAAALAVFRAEHRAYPVKLDELVPSIVDNLPVDLYRARPFIYERTSNGYLLYSAGGNGADDGGSDENMKILKGQRLSEREPTEAIKLGPQIPTGADDLSIRLPTSVLELSMIELESPPRDP